MSIAYDHSLHKQLLAIDTCSRILDVVKDLDNTRKHSSTYTIWQLLEKHTKVIEKKASDTKNEEVLEILQFAGLVY